MKKILLLVGLILTSTSFAAYECTVYKTKEGLDELDLQKVMSIQVEKNSTSSIGSLRVADHHFPVSEEFSNIHAHWLNLKVTCKKKSCSVKGLVKSTILTVDRGLEAYYKTNPDTKSVALSGDEELSLELESQGKKSLIKISCENRL